uniref:RNA-directed DNA polymerase n=1 Tax=Fagus sylvatica TaxID=28930 RepID=A0A2N9HZD1_FAGSY
MEGTHHHEGTSIDPPMTSIERQMQVIATSIQDLTRETTRLNKELWHVSRKGLPTPHDDNQPPPQRESRMDDQKADNQQVTRRRDNEPQKTPSPNGRREESAGSSAHPSRRRPDRTIQFITNFPLPPRFKVSPLKNFDGTKYPFDYLEAFKTIIQLQAVPEEIMCQAFPMGLRGSTRVWFNKLESESIGSFVYLSCAFIDHFIGGQWRGRLLTHLLNVKQMERESLRAYVHRFNKEAMQIDCPKEDVTLTAFMKHMNAEDTFKSRDDPPSKRRKNVEDRKQEPAKQKVPKFSETPERKRTTTPTEKFSSFTPLNTPIDKLLMQIQNNPSFQWLTKIRSDPDSRPKNLYCRFHRDHGHLTENCMALKEPPKNVRLDDQEISFSEENARRTHQPHDDTLVVTINIAGFTTRRVMIDNGSLVDILYLPAYQQMKLDKDKLRPMDTPLVGFTGDKVCLVNIITLPITVRTYSKTVSKTVDFLVVNCPSAYNAIIGRLTLNLLRAVTSTYHLLVKFPTEHGIGKVRGDQIAARECYLASLGSEGQIQMMMIEEWKTLVKPSEELDTIGLEEGQPEKTTRIGASLPPQIKESLIQFLRRNKDFFTWSHENMPRYNHIMVDENDQEKTSFITSRGLFCYKAMSFGLKNVGATYQRLMNRMFHDQIGRNVEVYVDDMLVKSKEEDSHLDDLGKTFKTLRKYQMKLNPSEELYLYLAVSPTTINSALLREEDGRQLPVYYTSRALRGVDEKYPPMEKLAFVLVMALRKLRPYFQAHTVIVLTNHPLRKAMNKPDTTRRLIQWSIELREFDIDYRPRTAIKAQALADFIAEFTSKDDKPIDKEESRASRWTIHADGSSTKNAGRGTEAVVPMEIGMMTFCTAIHDDQQNDEQIRLNLDLVDKVREQAKERMKRYQEKMVHHHNTKVKARQFEVGDLVLRKVTLATKDPTQGKLGPN